MSDLLELIIIIIIFGHHLLLARFWNGGSPDRGAVDVAVGLGGVW